MGGGVMGYGFRDCARLGKACSTNSRHTPRKRGIQYAAAFDSITDVSEYWFARFRGR